eukprot:gene10384-19082_t
MLDGLMEKLDPLPSTSKRTSLIDGKAHVSSKHKQTNVYKLAGQKSLFKRMQSHKRCPYIRGCTFEDDYCDSLRCNKIVEGHEIVLKFEMNICQDEIAVTVSISVPSLGVYYSHTFDSDQEIPIPGLGLGPLGSVYLKLESYRDETKHFNLKVSIALKLFGRVLKTFTIIDKDLGLLRKSMKCGFFAWLNDQSTGIKAAAYVSQYSIIGLKIAGLEIALLKVAELKISGLKVARLKIAGSRTAEIKISSFKIAQIQDHMNLGRMF